MRSLDPAEAQAARLEGPARDVALGRNARETELWSANAASAGPIRARPACSPEAPAALERFHRTIGELQTEATVPASGMRQGLTPSQTTRHDDPGAHQRAPAGASAPPEDAELAQRALAGEAAAFGHLMRRYKADVFRFARRYTGDPDAALEVVQESFVAAWRALARYDGARPFGAWLRTIALNKCRDRARQAFLRRAVFGLVDVDGPEARARPDGGRDPEAELLGRERLAAFDRALAALPAGLKEPLLLTAFDRALAALPAGLKEPLLLTAFEELSQQEAGRILGLTAKAVEIRVYRAKRRLAELLNVDGPEV